MWKRYARNGGFARFQRKVWKKKGKITGKSEGKEGKKQAFHGEYIDLWGKYRWSIHFFPKQRGKTAQDPTQASWGKNRGN